MKKVALLSLIATSLLVAGGYKIPETSTNAVALGAANIAHNHNNADAAYYNPAKMVFMSNKNHLEADVTYIGLEKVKYQGTVSGTGPYNLESEHEDFYIPTLHYVSPALGDGSARIGLSILTPGGLSKKWKTVPASDSAREFTLKTVEINPTAAFQINNKIGFSVGFRIVHSKAIAKNKYYDMDGNSNDVGYNLAVAYKPTAALEFGVTYRSRINLTLDGSTSRFLNPALMSGVSVDIPLPASINLAVAYTLSTQTTLELVYEKTYWSAYKNLDFNFANSVTEGSPFGVAKPKNWKDTNTFRVGLTQELQNLTFMAGYVYDNSPVSDATIGFELPDADSQALSLGGRYKINDAVDVGLSGIYSMHKSRTVNNASLSGEFTGGNVLILSAGLGCKF